MRVSIFGVGYVGAVSGACLSELGHEVIGVDKDVQKVEAINAGASPIIEEGVEERIARAVETGRLSATDDAEQAVLASDLSIISVGTPSAPNGSTSFTSLDGVIEDIGRALRKKNTPHAVMLRSTMPPGTTEGRVAPALCESAGRAIGETLSLSVNPEFLREGNAVRDFYAPPFTVVGSLCEDGFKTAEALYERLEAPFVRTDCAVAESLKYLSNVFHAVKITFANEFGALLKAAGLDAREALALFCQDKQLNISEAYLRPGFAFGGSCLPKEIRATEGLAKTFDIDLPMISNVLASNSAHIERAFRIVTEGGRRKVALFGLAFKPGTDDLRESPFVALAERLIGRGYELAIYDRCLEMGRLVGANRDFIEREIPHLDRLLATDPRQALEGAEVVVVGHVDAAAKQAILEHGDPMTLVDLQGIEDFRGLPGVDYQGICW